MFPDSDLGLKFYGYKKAVWHCIGCFNLFVKEVHIIRYVWVHFDVKRYMVQWFP